MNLGEVPLNSPFGAALWEMTIGQYYVEVWEQDDYASAGLWVGDAPVRPADCITKQQAASKEEALEKMILEVGKWMERNPIPQDFEEWFLPCKRVSAMSRISDEDFIPT